PTASTEGDGTVASTSTVSVGSGSVGGSGASQSTENSSCKQLPEGYTFADSQRTQDDSRSVAAENQLSQQDSSNNSLPPVLFYPNGETSDSVVTVANKVGVKIPITLRGLTGT